MKKLTFGNEVFEAEKITKIAENIIGQDNKGNIMFSFKGVSDFSLFQLELGQEWDLSKEDEVALSFLDLDFRISKIELGV